MQGREKRETRYMSVEIALAMSSPTREGSITILQVGVEAIRYYTKGHFTHETESP
jgi:hypothetical protein